MSIVNLRDLQGFLEVIEDSTREPGHGFIDVHPDYEKHLPRKPDIIWSNREVIDRETIRYQWIKLGTTSL